MAAKKKPYDRLTAESRKKGIQATERKALARIERHQGVSAKKAKTYLAARVKAGMGAGGFRPKGHSGTKSDKPNIKPPTHKAKPKSDSQGSRGDNRNRHPRGGGAGAGPAPNPAGSAMGHDFGDSNNITINVHVPPGGNPSSAANRTPAPSGRTGTRPPGGGPARGTFKDSATSPAAAAMRKRAAEQKGNIINKSSPPYGAPQKNRPTAAGRNR
jgi:hypothetical protein